MCSPPPQSATLRDRKGAVPVYKRPTPAWWGEVVDLEHTHDSDFKLQLRVPRAVFEDVLERIKSHLRPCTWARARSP